MQPHGRERSRQAYSDRLVSDRGKRPVERRAHIVDFLGKFRDRR